VWFFTANDGATTSGPPASATPGFAWTQAVPHAADVDRGNVVIVVHDAADVAAARRLADEVAGPATPALRAAGQAVLVDAPAPSGIAAVITCRARAGHTIPCPNVAAYARGRILTATSTDDPALRAFVEYWLGRAAG